MSTEAKKTDSTFGIVNAIMAVLKLDDAGILNKFYTKQIKRLNRNIKTFNQNIEAAKGNYEVAKEKLTEQIEDAAEYVRNAYLAVDPEKIKNNADIEGFEVIYWNTIAKKQNSLRDLEQQLASLNADYADEIKDIEVDIADMKEAITKIMKFKA